MLIRQILESIRKRTFSLLAVELFVVVVGVFIGIQVSNWNDERLDRVRAHSYLERIRADIDADIVNYRDRLEFWDRVSEYGEAGLDYAGIGKTQSATEWDLLLAFFQASQLAEFYTTKSTYEELKSGGELGLIGDLELRDLLARYYTNADNPVLTERPVYREHIRGLIPLRIQNYIWEHCYSSAEQKLQLLDCDSQVDPSEAEALVAAISGNAQLMSELRYWMSTMRVARIIGTDRTAFAVQLRDAVNKAAESS